MFFSIIVPVYNRPNEVREFLQSVADQIFDRPFEVVVIEDGSSVPSHLVCEEFAAALDISYFSKPNTGPGDSRNFGMKRAKGDYFLIFDSDCILPNDYLQKVSDALTANFCDCFGGPDAALPTFSKIQKAINFAMTSFLTTGGIRGGNENLGRFQPRSFNMGLSRFAFETSGGFGNIHPGEDPDLSIRLWELGFNTRLIKEAWVFHKRRIDWRKFQIQVSKFGKARPILDKRYPKYAKLAYFVPSLFLLGFLFSLIAVVMGIPQLLWLYGFYFVMAFVYSSVLNKDVQIGALSVLAIAIQFYGYGSGFLNSFVRLRLLNQNPQEAFPELFFKS